MNIFWRSRLRLRRQLTRHAPMILPLSAAALPPAHAVRPYKYIWPSRLRLCRPLTQHAHYETFSALPHGFAACAVRQGFALPEAKKEKFGAMPPVRLCPLHSIQISRSFFLSSTNPHVTEHPHGSSISYLTRLSSSLHHRSEEHTSEL